jgi:outer membrane protein assembly factor BamB
MSEQNNGHRSHSSEDPFAPEVIDDTIAVSLRHDAPLTPTAVLVRRLADAYTLPPEAHAILARSRAALARRAEALAAGTLQTEGEPVIVTDSRPVATRFGTRPLQPPRHRISGFAAAWRTMAAVLVVALLGAGFFALFHTRPRPGMASCGPVIEPTPVPTQSPNVHIFGSPHDESIVTSGENAYVGTDKGSIYAFSAASCSPLWQRQLASKMIKVYGVADGVVFANDTYEPSPLYALSATTGKVLWQFSPPGAIGLWVLVQDGVVYAEGESAASVSAVGAPATRQYTLTALQAKDGHVLWQEAPSPLLSQSELLGTGPGVVYIRQAVDNVSGELTSSAVSALDAGTGRVLWTATLVASDGTVERPPVVTSGIVYVQTSRGAVYALEANTGIQRWYIAGAAPQYPTGSYGIVAPAVANGLVYATGLEGVTAYRVTDGSVAWHYQPQTMTQGLTPSVPVLVSGVIYVTVGNRVETVALRASSGAVLWKRQGFNPPDFGPVLVDDSLLIVNGPIIVNDPYYPNDSEGGTAVYALKMTDGSQAWQASYTPSGRYYSEDIAAETLGSGAHGSGVLYIGSGDGVVHAVRMSDGHQLWRYQVTR